MFIIIIYELFIYIERITFVMPNLMISQGQSAIARVEMRKISFLKLTITKFQIVRMFKS